MQSLNRLDTPMFKLFNKAKGVPGDVGIELELEGSLKYPDDPYWVYKEEGSLRGGGEYILKKPVTLKALPDALGLLDKILSLGKPEISLRCSTHIHVNVSELSARQIWQFLLVYYLLEPLLMRTQPKKRWGNLFCLTMEYAEAVFIDLERDIKTSPVPFRSFTRDRNRYAALNLVAIGKFSSVEFRFLDAMVKVDQILLWSKTLHHLVQTGASTTPQTLMKMYDELTPQEFVSHFLGTGADLVFRVSSNPNNLNSLIHTNYDYVSELASMLANQKFEMPRHMWVEDLIEEGAAGIAPDPFPASNFPDNPPQWGGNAITQWLENHIAQQTAATPGPGQAGDVTHTTATGNTGWAQLHPWDMPIPTPPAQPITPSPELDWDEVDTWANAFDSTEEEL